MKRKIAMIGIAGLCMGGMIEPNMTQANATATESTQRIEQAEKPQNRILWFTIGGIFIVSTVITSDYMVFRTKKKTR